MTAGFDELEFDLPGALLNAILDLFAKIEPADLTAKNVAPIPEEQGIYALFLKDSGDLVYIGKTDSEAGLRRRLYRHAQKLEGRQGISPADVQFKAIRLFVFTAIDLERSLIQYYNKLKPVSWNNSGFGSNDPGKERDTTTYKADHWDSQYPIDLDGTCVALPLGNHTVSSVMAHLKSQLPYLLRYQRPGKTKNSFHADFESSTVTIVAPRSSAKDVIKLCVQSLPKGWHATALPSHVIVYKNDRRKFPSGKLISKS